MGVRGPDPDPDSLRRGKRIPIRPSVLKLVQVIAKRLDNKSEAEVVELAIREFAIEEDAETAGLIE